MQEHFNWNETPDLNITPLVDIMLVLLAILMVTTPTLVYEEEINLPQGSAKVTKADDVKIEIRVDIAKKVYIKDDVFNYKEFVENFSLLTDNYDKKSAVYIRADKNLKYDDVIYILKSVKQAGFFRVSLVTEG